MCTSFSEFRVLIITSKYLFSKETSLKGLTLLPKVDPEIYPRYVDCQDRISRVYKTRFEKKTSVSKNPPYGVSRVARRLFASGSCRLPEEETDYRVRSASPNVPSNACACARA